MHLFNPKVTRSMSILVDSKLILKRVLERAEIRVKVSLTNCYFLSDGFLSDGLLGSVLGGGRTRTGNGGLLSGGGILSGLLGQGNGGEREIEGMASGVESMFSTLQAMMAAGDTVMKTFPIADMVRTGYQLANSGLLDGAKGGGGKGTGATAPPTGGRCVSVPPKSKSCVSVGNPEVTCLSEGMRCCVPRIASPKYQVDP